MDQGENARPDGAPEHSEKPPSRPDADDPAAEEAVYHALDKSNAEDARDSPTLVLSLQTDSDENLNQDDQAPWLFCQHSNQGPEGMGYEPPGNGKSP